MSLSTTCRNLRLEGVILVADCLDNDTKTYEESRLNLNMYLGNDHGSFDISGRRFAESSRYISLSKSGTTLHAELEGRNHHDWRPNQFDLENCIQNVHGYLTWTAPGRLVPIGHLETLQNITPWLIRTSFSSGYPATFRNLRLEGTSVLVADCDDFSGQSHEARLDLDTVLGTYNGHFDVFNLEFSGSARKQRLEGSVLYAELRLWEAGFWQASTFDLKPYIHGIDGCLV